jgi:hypothetical protein
MMKTELQSKAAANPVAALHDHGQAVKLLGALERKRRG